MSEQGKEWTPPQLTVLTRGNQQENVMQICKVHAESPSGSSNYSDGVCTYTLVDTRCTAGSNLGAS